MSELTHLEFLTLDDGFDSKAYVDTHILISIVLSGSLTLTIPEIGSRQIPEKSWFSIGDRGVGSCWHMSQGSRGGVVPVPLAFLQSFTPVFQSENLQCWDCISCPKRSAPLFKKGMASGRMLEIAKHVISRPSMSMPEEINSIARCYELVSSVLVLPEFNQTAPCKRFASRSDIESIEKVATYLNANLAEDHSLNDLCKLCYINEFKLKKGFKEHYGTTVFGYLRRQRMHEAKQLLKTGYHSVMEVANEVGYSNASHFARAFRDEFGCNPAQMLVPVSR